MSIVGVFKVAIMSVYLKVVCIVILISGIPLGLSRFLTSAQPALRSAAPLTKGGDFHTGSAMVAQVNPLLPPQPIKNFVPPPVDPPKTTGGSGTR
jgi:hypothetical protein